MAEFVDVGRFDGEGVLEALGGWVGRLQRSAPPSGVALVHAAATAKVPGAGGARKQRGRPRFEHARRLPA
ncbi:MAG: hypothetical protein AAB409_02535, partial [Gemmatimonadota bacterium]